MEQPKTIDPEEWARFNEWKAQGGVKRALLVILSEPEPETDETENSNPDYWGGGRHE